MAGSVESGAFRGGGWARRVVLRRRWERGTAPVRQVAFGRETRKRRAKALAGFLTAAAAVVVVVASWRVALIKIAFVVGVALVEFVPLAGSWRSRRAMASC